jgi:DNA replication protein DnaC
MNNTLMQTARKLRLSGLLTSLELRLQEAQTHQLPHAQFLELIFQDELNVRGQRSLERRKTLACFRDTKTLEDFDWTFNPAIKRPQFYELATGQFIRQRRDVLLVGPPGLGKSQLAQAIGYHAIKAGFLVLYCSVFDLVRELQAEASPAELNRCLARYLKPDLLIIDDMGLKTLPPKAGEILLEIVLRSDLVSCWTPGSELRSNRFAPALASLRCASPVGSQGWKSRASIRGPRTPAVPQQPGLAAAKSGGASSALLRDIGQSRLRGRIVGQ